MCGKGWSGHRELDRQPVVKERRTAMGKKPGQDTKALLKGAFILTIAAFIIKILSAIYRVPFQNIVGDVGFYIYQQVYPIYGIAIVLTTYGFPVVISKLYASFSAQNDRLALKKLLDAAKIVLSVTGIVCFSGLFFGATWIAKGMGDAHLAPLIKVIAFVFLFMPFIAFIRGVQQGRGDMVPTAVSQVGEQFFRVTSILLLTFFLTKRGFSLYETNMGAMFGSVIGVAVSTSMLLFFQLRRGNHSGTPMQLLLKQSSVTTSDLVKKIWIQGVAICISGLLLIFIQLMDSMNMYALLVSSGIEETTAKSLKGVYDRGQPFIQLGTVAATSISLALIPFIAKANEQNNRLEVTRKIRLALQLSIVIGLGASAGLYSIIVPTNTMLFKNNNGSDVLAILAILIVFASAIMTLTAILQGLGVMYFPAFAVLAGGLLKYGLNRWWIPIYGTMGAATASVTALMVVFAILLMRVKGVIGGTLWAGNKRFLVIASAATATMMLSLTIYLRMTQFLFTIIPSVRLASAVQAVSAVCLGGFIFIVIIIRGGIFQKEVLGMLPFGNKLQKLLPKNKRAGGAR